MKKNLWSPILLAGVLGMGAPILGHAAEQSSAIDLLLHRADYWKSNGRMDLAVQNWQHVLQSNPNQPEALAGLARAAATQGKMQEAQGYLDRLKQVTPANPAIADIEGLLALGPNSGPRLAKAAQLAADKHYSDALDAYSDIFNGTPPPKWAQTYYQVMIKTPGGQKRAVNELTALAGAHPDEPAYRLMLGRVLTYDAATRTRGIKLLADMNRNTTGTTASAARDAWHQGLEWMGNDPAAIPYLRVYVRKYRDQALTARLHKLEVQMAARNAQRARGEALGNAYHTMNRGDLATARTRFIKILEKEPNNVKALEGLGDVAFRDKQYDDAARYYAQARTFSKSRAENEKLDAAAKKAHFWSWMQSGNRSLDAGQPSSAAVAYRQALGIYPDNALATQALANAYLKMGQTRQATNLYAKLTKKNPYNKDAWLGYMQTLNQANRPKEVQALSRKMPASVSAQLESNPDYVTILANAEADRGQTRKALGLLNRAMASAKPSQKTDLSIQSGWLLYKMKQDGALYALIMDLLSRPEALSPEQSNDLRTLYLTAAQREAMAALKNGDDKVAEDIVTSLSMQYPDDPGVARVHAGLLVQQKEFDKAEAIYRQIGPGDTPGDIQAAVGAAIANGDQEQAMSWLKAGRSQHPDNVPLKEMQARLDLKNGDDDAARATLKSALASLPMTPSFQGRSGGSSRVNKRYPFASAIPTPAAVHEYAGTNDYPFGGGVHKTTSVALSPEQTGVSRTEVPQTRARLQEQLDSIDAQLSSNIGGNVYGRSRSGTSGLDQVSLVGTQIEGSVALSSSTRMTARLTPIGIDAGALSATDAKLFGTGPIYGGQARGSDSETGLGFTLGVSSTNFGAMLGVSPLGFTESSLIGQLNLHPEGSPVGFSLFRESVTDSVLSFAGATDPQTGQSWGGVFRNGVGVNFGTGSQDTNIFGSLKLAYLNGTHVQNNTQVEGNFGADWSVFERENNHINVGVNVLSMFYAHDSSHFTLGQGGYFSPSYYVRPAVTMKWSGLAADRLGYSVQGFMGWQAYQRDSSPYFPEDSNLQAAAGNPYFASSNESGVGYGLKLNLGYAITRKLTMGGFLSTDNSQGYSDMAAGLQLKYWFAPQVVRSEKPLLKRNWLMGVDSGDTSPGR